MLPVFGQLAGRRCLSSQPDRLVSRSDEFPKQRNLLATFSDLNDRLARLRCRRSIARNSDDVLRNCKVVHALDREWKLLLRPAEHNLPNLTRFWVNRNFGAGSSGVLAVSILKRKMNI